MAAQKIYQVHSLGVDVTFERGLSRGVYFCVTREHKTAFFYWIIMCKLEGKVPQDETRNMLDLGRICREDGVRLELFQGCV